MKEQNIKITQEGGVISVERNGEFESGIDCNRLVKLITEGKWSSVDLANFIAERIHDSLNCKSAVATLKDLDEMDAYQGTYFERIDNIE